MILAGIVGSIDHACGGADGAVSPNKGLDGRLGWRDLPGAWHVLFVLGSSSLGSSSLVAGFQQAVRVTKDNVVNSRHRGGLLHVEFKGGLHPHVKKELFLS
jgi:hypothetical protein